MILVIDTSTRYAGVMLWEDGVTIISQNWYSKHNHTTELIPSIQHMFQRTGVKATNLTGISLAIGPGGFSALRVGISTAKGFSSTLGLPIVGISTLEIEAYPYAELERPICPILRVGKRELAWAIYQQHRGSWQTVRSEHITGSDQLLSQLTRGSIICGEGTVDNQQDLQGHKKQGVAILRYPGPSLRLWSLATLGEQRIKNGQVSEPATLQPLYCKKPNITPPNPIRKIKL